MVSVRHVSKTSSKNASSYRLSRRPVSFAAVNKLLLRVIERQLFPRSSYANAVTRMFRGSEPRGTGYRHEWFSSSRIPTPALHYRFCSGMKRPDKAKSLIVLRCPSKAVLDRGYWCSACRKTA